MNSAPSMQIDLADEADCLELACEASLVPYKQDLRRASDKLLALADEFCSLGLDETFEEHYLNLFDAVSFLTNAVRGRAIIVPDLRAACDCLERNFCIPH